MSSLRSVLITDRTQKDVSRAIYLRALYSGDGTWSGTAQELAELERSKGVYQCADINRVLRATDYLAGRLEELGTSVPFDYCTVYLMSAEARPRSGGIVRGDLKYAGEEAVVEAVPTDGFQFLWWEEAKRVVSKSPVYRFSAEGDRNLTAVFLMPSDADNGIVGIGRAGQARIRPKGE